MRLASGHRWALGIALAALLGLPAASGALAARAQRPADDLLGIRLGMDDRAARARLLKLGRAVSPEDSPKQTWNLRDRRYGSLTIRYDSEWRVLWMTAFARPGGAKVRYREIGDLSRARRTGDFIYSWTLPVSATGRPTAITARGTDPQFLSSVSIHPPGPQAPEPIALPDSVR